MTRRTASVLAATTLALVAAPAAHAATATIDGSPLNITASDIGSIQISFDGSAGGEFTPQPAQPAYAGFTASLRRTPAGTLERVQLHGRRGLSVHAREPGPDGHRRRPDDTRSSSRANFDAVAGGIPFAHVAEQIVYANGSSTVEVAYSITNATTDGSTLSGRFFESADLNVGGNGSGIGSSPRPRSARSAASTRRTGAPPRSSRSRRGRTTRRTRTRRSRTSSTATSPRRRTSPTRSTRISSTTAWRCSGISRASPRATDTGEGVVWNFGTATPTAPPPPVAGKAVNVNVVSGQVLLKVPGGKFVPLTNATKIPVGSQLDTSKGRVELTSAATKAGKTQTSDFYDGIFQVKQSVPKKKPKKPKALITDLVMKGQIARSQCAPLKGARSAAASPRRRRAPRRCSASCGATARASSVRTASTARRRCAGRSGWSGSLRRDVDQGHARHRPGPRPQAQEDRDGQGRPQLPRARPAGGQQESG